MKHLKLFAALCCTAMLFAACDKSNEPNDGSNNRNEPEPQKHSVDLKWFFDYVEEVTPENIQKNLDDPTVDTVYLALVNGGDFRHFYGNNVKFMRENFLGPRIEMGKGRVRGKGNFVFYPGVALPADSLWLVQQGWTVNQQNQR